MTISQQLAAFAARARDGGVPADVSSSVRRRVLDIAGVSLAALTLDTSDAIVEHARSLGGEPQARAIGLEHPIPAPMAAFVNGVLAHSLDFDDTHLPSILHPSASVIPATLAAADLAGADGETAARAIAAGLEICVRLGMAGTIDGRSIWFDRGQHATSICGAVASAASAATVLGLDDDGIAHAIGIAVSMGSGVIEGNRTGGTVKRIHCGIAAQSGVTAAMLAARGITGPPTSLEGRFGFFEAWLGGQADIEAVTDGLGTRWEVPNIFFKPYPANHFTHAGADAATSIRAHLALDDIASIDLRVASATVRTIGEPLDAKRAPDTGYQAQFSGPYVVTAALLGGRGLGLGLDDFTDALAQDPRRRALAALVTVTGDAECDGIYPNQFPAILRVMTKNGSVLEERVLANRGGPQRPLSDDELLTKFRDNAARVASDEQVAQIEGAALTMDSLDALLGPLTTVKGR